ncbi:hypothetical protein CLV56_2048 [Mumia flava]|uniref:Endonuclease III n=1 Tax=Mumia flava TaxID=1348852 RepID=A0A0B2B719_9ACTN|nr:hypothetical protein [Mumia flava]PJJ57810.1 hypothetical protein CLV56_2048 [Mumia flava]
MSRSHTTVVRLLDRYGRTFSDDAGITLRDKPSPLWRLLVLSLLLSARISSDIAVASAREVSRAGWRTPARMLDSTWQQRVDALGRGGYRRYDERTATQLADAAQHVRARWYGDLRRMHADAGDDPDALARRLQEVRGIGPAGAAIFLREAQAVWPGLRPYVDDLAVRGARALGLPTTPSRLAALVDGEDLARLVAGCVRAARDDRVADVVRG